MTAVRSPKRKTPRPPTIMDVARRANVSATTISFVLNGVNLREISGETQERVRTALRDLNYRPNAIGQLLRTRQSHTIGFITDQIASTPFATKVIEGAQQAAWAKGKILMIVNTFSDLKLMESAVGVMLERQVEGMIYAAMSHQEVHLPEAFHDIPLVLLDCYSENRAWASVVPDEVAGGETATEALIVKGHKRIGLINLPEGMPASIGRLKGYRRALRKHGLAFDQRLVRMSTGKADGGYQVAREFMELPNPPTAFFCATDHSAMGAYEALKEIGLRIPADIAVVGFDNQELISAYLRPPLSTVALPHYEMGRWAVEHTIRQTEKGEIIPIQHQIQGAFIERESI